MIAPRFVDVHSHVVPSGDDGAASVKEGLELCGAAANAGTRVLFATPHMHEPLDSFPWTLEREQRYEEAFAVMQPTAERMGLDLRRGREVYPTEALHGALKGFGWKERPPSWSSSLGRGSTSPTRSGSPGRRASESTQKGSSRYSPIRSGVPQLLPIPRPPLGSPSVGGRCA